MARDAPGGRRPHSGPLPPLPGACRTVTSGQASTRGQPAPGPASLPSGTSPAESSSTCSAPGSSPKATPLGPGRPSRLRGKQCGTASVGINGRLGSVMSASIQPRGERSPVVITSRSSGNGRKGGRARAARWRRLAAWRSRSAPSGWYQVRRSRRRVDRGAGRPGRAWEEVRGGVVVVVSGDETGAACGRGPAAGFSSRSSTRGWCRPPSGSNQSARCSSRPAFSAGEVGVTPI
jgi:hypothetical protein